MKRMFSSLVLLFALSGCAYYSFSGSLPGHIKMAAVPLFQNETTEIGLVEELTNRVEKAVLDNGAMKITGEFQADAVINGTVVNVIDEADEFSRDEQAKQFRLRIIADVAFFDRIKNRIIIEEKGIEGWARYDASGGGGISREEAKLQALDMLAKEIIDKTVTGW